MISPLLTLSVIAACMGNCSERAHGGSIVHTPMMAKGRFVYVEKVSRRLIKEYKRPVQLAIREIT